MDSDRDYAIDKDTTQRAEYVMTDGDATDSVESDDITTDSNLSNATSENESEDAMSETGSGESESEIEDSVYDSECDEEDQSETASDDAISQDEVQFNAKAVEDHVGDAMYIACQRSLQRRQLLKQAGKDMIECICECAKGILYGKIPISNAEKEHLRKHKRIMREIGDDDSSLPKRKKAIVQSGGGFLQDLIPIVIGAMSPE